MDSGAEGPGYKSQSRRCRVTVLGKMFTSIVLVHQEAKSLAALLRVAAVTAGLAESNGSLPPGLWLTSPAGWLPRTWISSGTLRSVIEYGLPLPLPLRLPLQTGHLWQYHFDTHTCWCWRSTSVRRVDIFRDTSYTTRPTYIYKLSTKFYLINLLRDKNNICHTTPMKQTSIFAQICSSWQDFNRPSVLACLLTLRQLRFLFTLRVDRCLKHVDRDAQSRRAVHQYQWPIMALNTRR